MDTDTLKTGDLLVGDSVRFRFPDGNMQEGVLLKADTSGDGYWDFEIHRGDKPVMLVHTKTDLVIKNLVPVEELQRMAEEELEAQNATSDED